MQAGFVTVDALRFGHGNRVVGSNRGTGFKQVGDQFAARGFTHVIGVGLEGQTPEGEVLAFEVTEPGFEFLGQDVFLGVIGFFDGSEHLEGDVGVVLGGGDQCLDVLGEAGAAVATAGVEEVVANARVGPDALADHFDVGTKDFCQVGQFVHEADAGGEHGVGGVLGEFGALDVGDDQTLMVALERSVEGAHQVDGLLFFSTDDDAVWTHEVFDGSAFLEEFRVGDDAVGDVDATLLQFVGDGGLDLGAGADRDGAFVDDDFIVGHQAADVAGGAKDVLEVGRAVFVRRGADGDELDGAVLDGLFNIGGEVQATGGDIAADHFQQAWLVDGDATVFENADLVGIEIETEDIVAYFGQTGATDQSHIAGTDDGDFHAVMPSGRID